MSGLTSGLKRGKRNGCDHSMSSAKGEAPAPSSRRVFPDGGAGRDLSEDNEDSAADLSACSDVVRLDLKENLGFGVVARLLGFGMTRSSSSSDVGRLTSGWSEPQSSPRAACDRGKSFLRYELDLRLCREPGVDGLPSESKDRSSASKEGMESLDVDLVCRYSRFPWLASGNEALRGFSTSKSSSSTCIEGLLPKLLPGLSSLFHSFTSSSIDMLRELLVLLLN